LFSLFPSGREAANRFAAFPVAAASRQRIALASLEKAPKIDWVYLLNGSLQLPIARCSAVRFNGS